MLNLYKEYRSRKQGKLPVIGWNEPHVFLDYKSILRKYQFLVVISITVLILACIFSGHIFLSFIGLTIGAFVLIKQRLFFRKIRSFFRYSYEIDFKLLKFAMENELNDDTVFTYIKDNDQLMVRVLKDTGKQLEKLESLDKGLVSLFGLPLDKKKIHERSVDYCFRLSTPERLEVSAVEQPEFTDNLNINLGYGISYNPAKTPHVLIAGGTGSGKSIFISFFLIELVKRLSKVYICDPKNSDLGQLKHYLGDDHVAVTPGQIAKLTRLAMEEMQKRFEVMNDPMNFQYGSNFVDHGFKPLWLIFDEMGAFQASGTNKESKKVVDETMANIKQIILLGRQAGCFILIAAQQMSASTLSTDLRDNLGLRIALGVNSPDGYRMVFNAHTPPSDSLPDISVKGSGLLYMDGFGEDQAQYYESPYVDMKTFNFIDELVKYQTAEKYDLGKQ
ncbi:MULTISPECIES: FtsK/SpoIIIE domain-containing protein [Liquorilactobacillus]|uniref:FtsK/SpoIIIE domain-containing protein n=1 Tax=Liquorilactobacillus TaxID=2767888 RepID=UPI001E29DD34|nr:MULTISPECIES: FtsK/SpoIIIE domain-containing protein [Liquorilactobacillus]MCC7667186.1 cell division protein FtsK [Liquorilactobacillus satsumensis]MCP9314996.1 cell division protein FtsK [Liquorilactobacillus nagelii]